MEASIAQRMREALRWLFSSDEPQWVDAEEVVNDPEQDVRFLRFQLTQVRAELTELNQRPDSFPRSFAALFHMPGEMLCQLPCRFGLWCWWFLRRLLRFCGFALSIFNQPTSDLIKVLKLAIRFIESVSLLLFADRIKSILLLTFQNFLQFEKVI